MSNRVSRIRHCLETTFSPSHLDIEDDSAAHAGHVGAQDGKGHFNVLIVSDAFAEKSLMARHRMVYQSLADMLETDIHALSIKAYSPEQYKT